MSEYVETCAHCRSAVDVYTCEACDSPVCGDCANMVLLSDIEGEPRTPFCAAADCLYRVTLRIDALPRGNAADNVHWRTKEKWRAEWTVLVKNALARKPKPGKPLECARLICTRHSSAPRLDYENLVQGFKIATDRLVAENLLSDDSMDVIVERHYGAKQAPPGKGYVTITLQELSTEGGDYDAVA